MDIKLDYYKIFNIVAEKKSFSEAAKKLYISQPAVSQCISNLEDQIGIKLFVRKGKTIELTNEGEILNSYISSAMNLIYSGENQILNLKNLNLGEIKIGASDTVSKWYLMPFLNIFHEKYPDISIKITNRTSAETIKLLEEGKIDIGFVNMPISSKGIIFEECLQIHDIFIAGEKYSFLKDKILSLNELNNYPLIMLENASNSRKWVNRHFISNGLNLHPSIELGAHDLLIDCAEIGLGISCVIKEFSNYSLNNKNIFEIKLKKTIPNRSIGICYLENIPLSPVANTFIDLLKKYEME